MRHRHQAAIGPARPRRLLKRDALREHVTLRRPPDLIQLYGLRAAGEIGQEAAVTSAWHHHGPAMDFAEYSVEGHERSISERIVRSSSDAGESFIASSVGDAIDVMGRDQGDWLAAAERGSNGANYVSV
jgi:hypothetical protein